MQEKGKFETSLGLVYAYFTTMAGTTPVVAAKVLPLSTVPSKKTTWAVAP